MHGFGGYCHVYSHWRVLCANGLVGCSFRLCRGCHHNLYYTLSRRTLSPLHFYMPSLLPSSPTYGFIRSAGGLWWSRRLCRVYWCCFGYRYALGCALGGAVRPRPHWGANGPWTPRKSGGGLTPLYHPPHPRHIGAITGDDAPAKPP